MIFQGDGEHVLGKNVVSKRKRYMGIAESEQKTSEITMIKSVRSFVTSVTYLVRPVQGANCCCGIFKTSSGFK